MLPRQIGCFWAADGPQCGSVRFFCAPGRAGTGIGCATSRRTAEGARAVSVLRAELQKGRGPWRHFRPSGRGCGPCGASVSEGGGSEVGKVRKGVAGGSSSGGGEVRVGVTGSRSVGGEVRVGVADGSRSVAGAARIGAVRVGTARIGETVDWIRVGRGDVGGAGMIQNARLP